MRAFVRTLASSAALAAAAGAALTLSACGGGDAATPVVDATPAGAVDTLRRRALNVSAAAVAPDVAAGQLMDFAQRQFPQYFPLQGGVSPPTQPFGPFLFRYYAASGVYLGVVVQADPGYTLMGVYVMGGPFGNEPLFVGPLSSFITAVDPNPNTSVPTGVSNGCFDRLLALDEAPGTQVIEVYRTPAGAAVQDYTVHTEVMGPAAFEGQATTQQRVRSAPAAYPDGVPTDAPFRQDNFRYYRKTGPAEVTVYGDTGSITSSFTAGGISTSTQVDTRSTYEPPKLDRIYSLPVGGSDTVTTTYRTRSVTTTTRTGQPPTTTDNTTSTTRTETSRFLRRETVTVPLGTFTACVFEFSASDTPGGTMTTWIADGIGVALKQRTVQGTVVSEGEVVAARINGQPVRP